MIIVAVPGVRFESFRLESLLFLFIVFMFPLGSSMSSATKDDPTNDKEYQNTPDTANNSTDDSFRGISGNNVQWFSA